MDISDELFEDRLNTETNIVYEKTEDEIRKRKGENSA
jgi:hypothetical protein